MQKKQLTYALNPHGIKENLGSYNKAELELMTTFHLREICNKEKIIDAAMDKMDKDELIRVILRFRGREKNLLITRPYNEGKEHIFNFMHQTQLILKSHNLTAPAKIVAWEGLDTNFKDNFEITFKENLVETNALIVSNDREICSIWNVETLGKRLFLTRNGNMPCYEALSKNYSVLLFAREYSDILYHLYYNDEHISTPLLELYKIPILDFQVNRPVSGNFPLVIDFGTSTTCAGTFIDHAFFEKVQAGIQPGQLRENGINYVEFWNEIGIGVEISPIIPTVIAVKNIEAESEKIEYVFGYEAEKLAKLSYIDEGFCVFYDIKRWVSDYDSLEELTDLKGRRAFAPRREIMKSFLYYIIKESNQRFKCNFDKIYMSCPVKQKKPFFAFYKEVLNDYTVDTAILLDEGMSVLYNSIGNLIDKNYYAEDENYGALIIDCGGGTTDLSSCTFSIRSLRVSYDIQIEASYENGDANFGGNNITFRIMQLLKIALVNHFMPEICVNKKDIISNFGGNIFRFVDSNGTEAAYAKLEEEYAKAERVLPTRFKDYEQRGRKEYYQVKNNYYFLFDTAEHMKKLFFGNADLLELTLSSDITNSNIKNVMQVDKWKVSVNKNGVLEVIKNFPEISFSVYELEQLIKADIYAVISKFMQKPYENDELRDYSIIKLTGQSCRIPIFRDCLKEFIPGKMIQFSENNTSGKDYSMKLACLDGSIRYMVDRKFGYSKVALVQKFPNLPYTLTGFTHTGREVVLLRGLDRENTEGNISRTFESTAIQLTLKDLDKNFRYKYTINCDPADAVSVTYEEIAQKYSDKIVQDDVDNIVNGEVKYFVWADSGYWGFTILPILRDNDQLKIEKEQFRAFENEHWVSNYFDGTR
jgi:hypothetical protein